MEEALIAAVAALFGLIVGGAKYVWSYITSDKDKQIAARDLTIAELRTEIRGYLADDRDVTSTLQRTIDALLAEKEPSRKVSRGS